MVASSPFVSLLFVFLLRTVVIGFDAHLDNLECSHFEILNISAKMLFLNKVIFTGPKGEDVDIFGEEPLNLL